MGIHTVITSHARRVVNLPNALNIGLLFLRIPRLTLVANHPRRESHPHRGDGQGWVHPQPDRTGAGVNRDSNPRGVGVRDRVLMTCERESPMTRAEDQGQRTQPLPRPIQIPGADGDNPPYDQVGIQEP